MGKRKDSRGAAEEAPKSEAATPAPVADPTASAPVRRTGATAWDWMIETGNDLESVAKKVGWIAAILFLFGNKGAREAVADAFGTAVEVVGEVKDTLVHPQGEMSKIAREIKPHVEGFIRHQREALARERDHRLTWSPWRSLFVTRETWMGPAGGSAGTASVKQRVVRVAVGLAAAVAIVAFYAWLFS